MLCDLLATEREELILRRLRVEDAKPLFALIATNRKHLSQHGDVTSRNYRTFDDVRRSITHPRNPGKLRMGLWCGEKLVGSINLTPHGSEAEIGYFLSSKHTGEGYMTSAVQALTAHGLDSGFKSVYAIVHAENFPSRHVLRRAGYKTRVFTSENMRVLLTYP